MSYRHFLRFSRNGSTVNVYLDTLLGVDRPAFELPIRCENEVVADLLCDHLAKMRCKLMEEAQTKAYDKGYRDGRAKRARQSYFPPFLGIGP